MFVLLTTMPVFIYSSYTFTQIDTLAHPRFLILGGVYWPHPFHRCDKLSHLSSSKTTSRPYIIWITGPITNQIAYMFD